MRASNLILFYILLCFSAHAQNQLKGRVIDEKTNEPLEFVSVFLNTTSVGAQTNSKGEFSFAAPSGKYELIVSYTGYEPIVLPLDLTKPTPQYLFKLQAKANALQEVEIKAKRDQSWYDNLAIFKEHFLGKSSFGRSCILKNPEVLKIHFDPESGLLQVNSRDLLVIENPKLGYQIKYLLQEFKYYTRKSYVSFLGYPSYKPMKGSDFRMRRWEQNRLEAYNGSAMHFIRTLYKQQLEEAGFNLRRLYRYPNPDRPSEEQFAAVRRILHTQDKFLSAKQKDSLYVILNKASLPRTIEMLDKNPVPYSAFLSNSTQETKLSFPHFLQVVYSKEKEELAYANSFNPFKPRAPGFQTSVISFQSEPKQVIIYENGSLDDPLAIMFEGYWGWEKLGEMLPLDYTPAP